MKSHTVCFLTTIIIIVVVVAIVLEVPEIKGLIAITTEFLEMKHQNSKQYTDQE